MTSSTKAISLASRPVGRVMAWAQALREWSLANPEGFQLVHGAPLPSYRPPPDDPRPRPSAAPASD